jgi:hypothetical protein
MRRFRANPRPAADVRRSLTRRNRAVGSPHGLCEHKALSDLPFLSRTMVREQEAPAGCLYRTVRSSASKRPQQLSNRTIGASKKPQRLSNRTVGGEQEAPAVIEPYRRVRARSPGGLPLSNRTIGREQDALAVSNRSVGWEQVAPAGCPYRSVRWGAS